jgi:glucosylceramidase
LFLFYTVLPTDLSSSALGASSDEDYVIFTTSSEGERFHKVNAKFEGQGNGGWQKVEVDVNTLLQEFNGIGGAFTDAAILNLNKMNEDVVDAILTGYFGSGGIKYSVGRVPIASCDFSDHAYSYNDMEGDFGMTNFTVSYDESIGKFDYIKRANDMSLKTSGEELKLFASPWSAPGWMKDSGSMVQGSLKGSAGDNYHQAWALYFKTFLDEYAARGVRFWAVTTQN